MRYPFQRVVIAMDLIPHLPPGFLGYRHFGNKWHLKHKNSTTSQPVIVSEDDSHEEDPQEALDLWDKWVESVDQSNSPVMRPPIIARMWMTLRSDAPPVSMSELFESDEWKRLKAINSAGNSASSKDRLFDLNGEVQPSQELASDQRGDWFNWHALDRYIAKLQSLIGNDLDSEDQKIE